MSDYLKDLANNIIKGNPPSYLQSCLVLSCVHCLVNRTSKIVPSVLFFEKDLDRLEEGVICPACSNSYLPNHNFYKMVKHLMFSPFNIYSKDLSITFENRETNFTIPIRLENGKWVLADDVSDYFVEKTYEIDDDGVLYFIEAIKEFDFKNWSFTIRSQNSGTILVEDVIDFL